MKLFFPYYIAKRYLFSKKKHKAINLISIVSMIGILVATMAMVIVLSVMNGFEGMVKESFTVFHPEIKISSDSLKRFDIEDENIVNFLSDDRIDGVSYVYEEMGLLAFGDRQRVVTIKGVDSLYYSNTNLGSIIIEGAVDLTKHFATVGVGVANALDFGVNYVDPIVLYAPKRVGRINISRPDDAFNEEYLYSSSVFCIGQAEYDDKYILVPIYVAQSLFESEPYEVTSIDIRLKAGTNIDAFQKHAINRLGKEFKVENRYQQQQDFYRIIQIEKWISFFILTFILVIAVTNTIGSLSMLMIEKKRDIQTLRSLGATPKTIGNIFLIEGTMISTVGAFVGLILGLLVSLGQQHFGWLKINAGLSPQNYPVIVMASDIIIIAITVFSIGILASLYTTKNRRNGF